MTGQRRKRFPRIRRRRRRLPRLELLGDLAVARLERAAVVA